MEQYINADQVHRNNIILVRDQVSGKTRRHRVLEVEVTHMNYVHIDGVCYDALLPVVQVDAQ